MKNMIYSMQFPGIKATDTTVVIGNATYPTAMTVEDVIKEDSRFRFAPGIGGVKTLQCDIVDPTTNLIISVDQGGSVLNVGSSFIGGRPIRRPNGRNH